MARARIKIGVANMVYNVQRLAPLKGGYGTRDADPALNDRSYAPVGAGANRWRHQLRERGLLAPPTGRTFSPFACPAQTLRACRHLAGRDRDPLHRLGSDKDLVATMPYCRRPVTRSFLVDPSPRQSGPFPS